MCKSIARKGLDEDDNTLVLVMIGDSNPCMIKAKQTVESGSIEKIRVVNSLSAYSTHWKSSPQKRWEGKAIKGAIEVS